MPSNYPGALDSFSNPQATDAMNATGVEHASQHDNINDSLVAVQTVLGTNPHGTYSNVAARLGNCSYVGHTHVITDVTNLQTTLNGKATLTTSAPSALGSTASVGVATTAALADHVHPFPTYSQVGAAASVHTHVISDVTSLQTSLNAKANTTTTISAGSGLSGGGDLSANRTVSVNFGGTGAATTVARSDHNHDGTYTKYVIQTLGSTLPTASSYPAGTIVAQY